MVTKSAEPRNTTGTPHGQSLYIEIVQGVAEVQDTDPLEMPPLRHVVDLEALDRLFNPAESEYPELRGAIGFEYAGCDVEIQSNGDIQIEPLD